MLELVLLILALFLGGLLVTLLLLRLTRNRFKPLRLLPFLPVGYLWICAWQEYSAPGFFSGLAAFFNFFAGALILLGWGLAFLIVFFTKRRKAKCQKEENSAS